MWIKSEVVDVTDGIPLYENELMEEEGEALDKLIDIITFDQELPETFHVIDDISEQMIELEVKDYMSDAQINMINAMLMHTDDWEEQHIRFNLEYVADQERTSGA